MGVQIDKTGGDDGAIRIDPAFCLAGDAPAQFGDAAILNRDIAGAGRAAGAVDYFSTRNDGIEHRIFPWHCSGLSAGNCIYAM
jgi:hypothetical protein